MRGLKIIFSVFLLFLIFTGCSSEPPIPVTTAQTDAVTEITEANPVTEEATQTAVTESPVTLAKFQLAQYISSMTLREKIGQLLIVTPDSAGIDCTCPENSAQLQDALNRYPVGGLILFDDDIDSPDQLSSFHQAIRNTSAVPLFLCIDEEGGTVSRLANHNSFNLPRFESAQSVGASGIPGDATKMGQCIGSYLSHYGFNVDFAPVADVNTNSDNQVIGERSFSSDPHVAGAFSRSMADGLNQAGIVPVFKHFPGHGDTSEDSHFDLAVTQQSADEMEKCHWIPFMKATAHEVIMVGHIAAPNVTGDSLPASLSPYLVTEILKNHLGFQGLIVTDALDMGAITNRYRSSEAAVMALKAGCHLLLMPENLDDAFDGISAAVSSGALSEEALDLIVEQVLSFKLDRRIWIPDP